MKTTIRLLALTIIFSSYVVSLRAQSFIGVSARLLDDGKSIGGSVEMGWQLSDPNIIIIGQAAFIYHQPNYSRISDSEYYALTGQASITAWMPGGAQMSLSVQPCYAISSHIAIGPTLGITARTENEVFSVEDAYGNEHELGYSSLQASKLFFLPNLGATINIALQPLTLILDYGTQTGAGVGLAFPL